MGLSTTSVATILAIACLGHARVLLYDTELNTNSEYFDCIYHTNGSTTVKYCRRPEEIMSITHRYSWLRCLNGGVMWPFSKLLSTNITPSDVLTWSSSVEVADNYAMAYYSSAFYSSNNDSVCNCTQKGTFGKHCEYQLFHDSSSFEQALNAQFAQKEKDIWGNQEWGDILCYKTLSCNSGMRCLDWREICDGEQQCMDGEDEENCDKLEFNECEEHEYRCVNGMCIAEEYWIDGEADCMDMSDERLDAWGLTCPFEPRSMDCDEHLCFRERSSCGDGQCIQPKDYFVFQTRLPFDWHCSNLREFSYMCETSTRWRLWTKTNGLCVRTFGYNDLSVSMNNRNLTDDDKCVYLIRCALSRGLEFDCPCDHTNCTQLMTHLCKTAESYAYPPKGVIRPFIKMYYEWNRENWLSQTPDHFIAEGSLKCRGFHGTVNGSELNYTTFLIDRTMIDFRVCTETSIHRNITSSIKYDESCWNDSHTFNNRSYAYYDICSKSRECISQYRIKDGYNQCGDDEDEEKVVNNNLCLNLRKHRLQCSSNLSKCLFVYKLGNSYGDCTNGYDEHFYGTGSAITEITCNKRHEIGCSIIRDYMNSMVDTSSSTRITTVARKFERFPFRSYCNSFWNTDSRLDESSEYCYHWICRSDQYQCKTGQCINLDWVCDGEWDCVDASDEEALPLLNDQSSHNRAIHGLINQTQKCHTRYTNGPFSTTCNISTEYPCYIANVTNPMNMTSNRPCVKLTKLGDGVEDCYGGLDEKNTLPACNGLMLGFTYRCARNPCIRYPYACEKDSDDCMDEVLCSYKSKNKTWCSAFKDVVCLNGMCKKNARCNGIVECPDGEDEFWCSSNSDYYGQRFYRWSKEVSLETSHFLYLPIYPILMPEQKAEDNKIAQYSISSSSRNVTQNFSQVYTYYNYSYICNRGVAISTSNGTVVCFCPPAFYGLKCEYCSDRLTIITHLDQSNSLLRMQSTSSSIFTIVATLVYIDRVISYHLFQVNSSIEPEKHRFYLLYSRSEKKLQYKQTRYFNRTDIINHHPYSVWFDLYQVTDNTVDQRGSWHYKIFFDFLPSFRLAVVLKFPTWFGNATADPCLNITCNENSYCQPIFNQNNSFYCSCRSGFYGPQCQNFEAQCTSFCSPNSICKTGHRSVFGGSDHPLCICPLNRFGPSCNLRQDACNSSPCAHNAMCRLTYDLSGERPFICVCSKEFYGDRCQFEKIAIRIDLNMSVSPRASVVQFYDVHNSSLELLIQHQQAYHSLPTVIRFDHGRTKAPIFGLLKTYDDTKKFNLFVLYIQPNTSYINITSTPIQCVHSSVLAPNGNISIPAVFQYHQLCQKNVQLVCFYDDDYLCICQDDHNRTDCFGHSLTFDQCSLCLSGGRCIQGDLNDDKDFICVCPECHQGQLCEFTMRALGFTIDSLLIADDSTIQSIYIGLTALLFFFGLFNNMSSFVTFKRTQPRKCNVGTYLLIVSILNQCALLCLLLKFIHIFLGSFGGFVDKRFTQLVSCKILSYLLSVFTRAAYWLTSWVTLDRLYIIVFPTTMAIKNSHVSIWLSTVTVIILAAMHIDEVLYYTIVQNHSNTFACVINFENPVIASYNRISTIINYLGPFALQTGATTWLIVLIARSRTKATGAKTFRQVFKTQFFKQRELYLTPIVIIVSALPQLVFSFSLACTQLHVWQRRTLLVTYLLSYAPQVLGFILFVLPSHGFKKEFSETYIGKTFSQIFGL